MVAPDLNSAEFPPLTRLTNSHSPEPTQSWPAPTKPASTQQITKKSFASVVSPNSANEKPLHPSDSHKFFLANSNTIPIGVVNTVNGRPTIVFSDSETRALAENFRLALIGKFSQGTPPYSQLHRLLANLGLKGAFTVSMINSKHALISLTDESDYSRLWLRRIWYLKGFPMRVFKWTPTFTPAHESSIVPVWVSLPALPAHLFCKDVLFTIANIIGTPSN
ncbi:UNVERIFIED_CONTAM: hypothetical protein Sradi_3240800 [Sesamum radiatum]|uniref:DUF4283 domain-containing protein n=1 Tax=Sesamum radiatum TaxID=300843 RepID=A0AAW2RIR3_SESRA